ncbi:hypothetical protein [Litoreibacter ponti]|uniref:hypothetical protein n=1 Tax=Litoreibacter ponti TaxID=1510457 RepID=UPI001304BFA5|nr:hypothetical protein [Litoreibacter ponti]
MHVVPHQGVDRICAGALELHEQLFIDQNPSGFGFAQKTHDMTAGEVSALFADV